MSRTIDMFADLKPPRAKPRVLMHVTDAGWDDHTGKPMCAVYCDRCGAAGWWVFDTVTEAKRGIPCEACNAPPVG